MRLFRRRPVIGSPESFGGGEASTDPQPVTPPSPVAPQSRRGQRLDQIIAGREDETFTVVDGCGRVVREIHHYGDVS